jgi:DNA-binding protein HU-beta
VIKKDLVNKIVALGFPKKQAKESMEAVIEAIGAGLAKGEKIQLQGLGSFEVRTTKERKGRNLKTGEPLIIPSRKVPVFRPAPILRKKIRHAD